jgi:ribose transport system ATP-binding protein
VMRDGVVVTTLNTRETCLDDLLKLMVGRELKAIYPRRMDCIQDEVILETQHLGGNGLKDISFQLRRGEVLGLAGLIGSGRTQLAELIFGAKPRNAGRIIFKGEAIDLGIALVPEDRKRQGVLLAMDIKSNICMAILKRLATATIVNARKETETAERFRRNLGIKASRLEQQVKNLSGGNQQKVVIAKWLASDAELIILDEPTRGIDVGAKSEIYKLINTLVESGKAVLMISSEMEEVLGMSDRIIVLSEGKVKGILDKEQFSQEAIMERASIGFEQEGVAS